MVVSDVTLDCESDNATRPVTHLFAFKWHMYCRSWISRFYGLTGIYATKRDQV